MVLITRFGDDDDSTTEYSSSEISFTVQRKKTSNLLNLSANGKGLTFQLQATCLGRPDVALLGFAKFFKSASLEEQEHARTLAQFINMRGGTVQLCDVAKPEPVGYHDPELALEESILLEKNVLKNIEELHKKAVGHNDLLLTDLLESQFIPEQYKGLQQLGEMLTSVRRAGASVGLVLLDLDMQRRTSTTHGGIN